MALNPAKPCRTWTKGSAATLAKKVSKPRGGGVRSKLDNRSWWLGDVGERPEFSSGNVVSDKFVMENPTNSQSFNGDILWIYMCVYLLCGMYMYSCCLLPLITCTSTLFLCLLIYFVPLFVSFTYSPSSHPTSAYGLMYLFTYLSVYQFIYFLVLRLSNLSYLYPSINCSICSIQAKPIQSKPIQSNLFISVSVFQYELSWTCAQIIAIESC